MTTLERAKKDLEKRKQEEKNMLRSMNKEIDNYKEYWCVCREPIMSNGCLTIKECEGLI